MADNDTKQVRKRALSSKYRLDMLRSLQKMGATEVIFKEEAILSVKFCQNSVEKKTVVRQDKPKELSEEDRQRKADIDTLRKAEMLDDLLLDDPISYEEAIIREGMLHNGESNG